MVHGGPCILLHAQQGQGLPSFVAAQPAQYFTDEMASPPAKVAPPLGTVGVLVDDKPPPGCFAHRVPMIVLVYQWGKSIPQEHGSCDTSHQYHANVHYFLFSRYVFFKGPRKKVRFLNEESNVWLKELCDGRGWHPQGRPLCHGNAPTQGPSVAANIVTLQVCFQIGRGVGTRFNLHFGPLPKDRGSIHRVHGRW